MLLLAAGLALADASIVTLALPPIIDELDASVEGAAAVLGVYTFVLAVALPAAAWFRASPRVLGLFGGLLFFSASVGCGLAGTLDVLLALRALQAGGAAAVLVSAFSLLDGGGVGQRGWHLAAVVGFAAGPALGGALTQAFDWRAIFLAQAPIALAGAIAAWRSPSVDLFSPGLNKVPLDRVVALALVSASLVGVLFLLVLLFITGWSISPLAAAAAVSVLPLSALAVLRVRGSVVTRAAAGALLIAGGILALASLPTASVAWTIVPQLMAGAGMGLALTALSQERTATEAANLLAARHAGITIALALLAPVAADRIDTAVAEVREQGTALVLDARLPPLDKLELARSIVGDLDPVDPRGQLQRSLARAERGIDAEDRPEYERLAQRADEALVAGVQSAFAPAFAICGALAILAAIVLRPRSAIVLAAAAAALVLAVGARIAQPRLEPEPVRIADPCQPRKLPETGGIDGAIQDAALTALDRAACRYGSSREALALALVDDGARDAYEREYGVDPRSIGGLLRAVLGL